jgi:G3E family GTPase
VRVPTNIVTGFLGVGKTTAILDLLANATAGERWAVLVNEYGDVGIDGAILADRGVTVREVAGGCVCCATAPYLQVALHLLMVEANPERILIETTGLGHPSQLIERLRKSYSDRLDLRATLTFVSPDDFETPGMLDNPIFREQVDVADVLVLNKLDRATPKSVAAFQDWANALVPPKSLVAATRAGRIERDWLDLRAVTRRSSPTISGDSFEHPGALGLEFPDGLCFDGERLLAVLASVSGVVRLKGVFRTVDGAIAVNRIGGDTTIAPLSSMNRNGLQVFGRELDRRALERLVLECSIEGERLIASTGDGRGHRTDIDGGPNESRTAVGHEDVRAGSVE